METSFNIQHGTDFSLAIGATHEILLNDWASVQSRWGELKAAWNDQQFDKFADHIESLLATYKDLESEYTSHKQEIDSRIITAQEFNQRLGNIS